MRINLYSCLIGDTSLRMENTAKTYSFRRDITGTQGTLPPVNSLPYALCARPLSRGHFLRIFGISLSTQKSSTVERDGLVHSVYINQTAFNKSVLADQVKFLIGAYGQRLVFLDSNGWVCSVDLGIRNVERHTRHFFIPFDWLSAGAELTIDVTCNGDIIFVKRHEISVKRSLEASEQGPNTAGARSTIRVAPRPSLASSRSSGSDDICLRPYTEEKRSSLPVGPTKWSEDMFPWSL